MLKPLLIIVFVISNLFLKGQEVDKAVRMGTNPLEIYFTGINIAGELQSSRNIFFGTDLSFKPAFCNGCDLQGGGAGWNYIDETPLNENYNALGVSIYTKLYHLNQKIYFSPQIFFRQWWFSKKSFTYPNIEGYRFSGLRSESQSRYGFRILLGHTFIKKFSERTCYLDLSAGMGIFTGKAVFETFNGYVYQQHHRYLKETKKILGPTFHIRIQIGLQWYR